MLKHLHLLARCEVEKPPTNSAWIENWLGKLVEDLGMNILYGPFSMRCDLEENEGFTAGCVLSTSHCMLHTWDKSYPAVMQLDVYTCSELDPELIWKAIQQFKPVKIDYKLLDRESNLTTVFEKSS